MGHEMTELQTDEYAEETDVNKIQTEDANGQADLATDSETGHEENTDDGEQKQVNQDAVNEAINKQHRKYQEEKRRADAAEQRVLELTPKRSAPAILDRPDPFDDDYDTKISAYENSIRQAERHLYAQEQEQQTASKTQQDLQFKQQDEITQKTKSYSDKAKELGIKPEDLQKAGQTIAGYGLSEDVAMFILSDDQGPLITQYLANNFAEAEKIVSMGSMQAAMYIERTIRPKASSQKPRVSNTPAPATRAGVGGAKPAEDFKYLDGATFE